MKAHSSLVTSIVFTNDKSTMITSGRDAKVTYYNAKDNFKVLSSEPVSSLGINEEEVNAIQYINVKDDKHNHPFLIIGGTSGGLAAIDIKS